MLICFGIYLSLKPAHLTSDPLPQNFLYINPFNLIITLCGFIYVSHSTDEETEVKKG